MKKEKSVLPVPNDKYVNAALIWYDNMFDSWINNAEHCTHCLKWEVFQENLQIMNTQEY